MPHDASILDEERLRRFMSYSEPLGDGVGQFAVFDDQYSAAMQSGRAVGELSELLIGVRADRTLRAMLENENGIRVGPAQELFEITFFA
jgi:hypothetical protein